MNTLTKLDPKAYYMNPETGSVAEGKIWEIDFNERQDKEDTWEDWGGDSLIEVVYLGRYEEWVEVDSLEGCSCGHFCDRCLGMSWNDFV